MKAKLISLMIWLTGIYALVGCSVMKPLPEGDASEDPRSAAKENQVMAVVNYANVDFSNPEVLTEHARAGLVVLETSYLWKPGYNEGAVNALKAINPDIKVLGYFNAQTSWLDWGDDPESDRVKNPYGWDWYNATKPFWSATTEGDTMMSWPGKVLLNILDPDCRAAIVGVIADHWNAHENVLDGVMWDHFNTELWVSSNCPGVVGTTDLDQDGIAHLDDPDEIQAYRDASVELIKALRLALGDDVIQVTNGSRAARDSVFAGLVDGMMYENFPENNFGSQGMEGAFDPGRYNNLFAARNWPRKANGGPYLLLTNPGTVVLNLDYSGPQRVRLSEFNRAAALLAGALVSFHPYDEQLRFGWPEENLDLGAPLGLIEKIDGGLGREFENGRVEVDWSTANRALPCYFEIHQGGEVVQEVTALQ